MHKINHIVMAPMTRSAVGFDGIPIRQTVDHYRQRAEGEVGLIITEGVYVDDIHAPGYDNVPGIYNQQQTDGWKKVVDGVHQAGGAIGIQLWHTGRFAFKPIGPIATAVNDVQVMAMTEENFKQSIEAYVQASTNGIEAGFDFIEIHGGHGYLLDSFLSKVNNLRTDSYGGRTVAERATFPAEVIKAIRKKIGNEFPIIYRFSQWSVDNYKEIKFSDPSELKEFTDMMVNAGVSVLHPSTRNALVPAFPDIDPKKTLAEWTKELSGIPVIAVGKTSVSERLKLGGGDLIPASDPSSHLALVNEGRVDLLAVGRSLIANPDWVRIVRDDGWERLLPWEQTMWTG